MYFLKNFNLKISALGVLFLIAHNLCGQEITTANEQEKYSIYFGYYAPYGIHIGTRAGIGYTFKKWRNETRTHRLDITPRIGYFFQPEVQQNYILDATLDHRWYKPHRKIHPKVGIGLGYILARQNIGGTVNLANGDIDFEKRSLNFFTPTLNIGFEKNKAGRVGYYFTAFLGRKFTRQEVDSSFIGIEFGITFNREKKANHG